MKKHKDSGSSDVGTGADQHEVHDSTAFWNIVKTLNDVKQVRNVTIQLDGNRQGASLDLGQQETIEIPLNDLWLLVIASRSEQDLLFKLSTYQKGNQTKH